MTIVRAAGVLFLTPEKMALFLRRGDGSDHPGEWCFPGGQLEDGETAEQAAVREAGEEAGDVPDGPRAMLVRNVRPAEVAAGASSEQLPAIEGINPAGEGLEPGEAAVVPGVEVDFTTFLQRVDAPFPVTINYESTGWAWAHIDGPPEPLHPGCRLALARLGMDELGIARAMAAGELTSPQRYMNVTLWAIRITGTGVAYRRGVDEFVFRRPDLYLTDDFLARCNGLPVIMEHPKKAVLDSQEFADRVVGAVLLPYLKLDEQEVWGIAKVYDDAANEMMADQQMSTSPSVVLKDAGSTRLTLDSGDTILVEGEIAMLDHIAVCVAGVWDKLNEPAGVDRAGAALPDSDPQPVARPGLDPAKLNRAYADLTTLSVRLSNHAARRRA